MKAHIVLGTQFGDEGKGLVTDWLCSQNEDLIVVRFNGGQQAGHTVQIGTKHVHSSFGSGTLAGHHSYFSEHCTLYPPNLFNEWAQLVEKGVYPVLRVHPLAMVTTPYDVAWNRASELRNGHGSCGLGIAATNKRTKETPYKLFACDLRYPGLLRAKLSAIAHYYAVKVSEAPNHMQLSFPSILVEELERWEVAQSAPFQIDTIGYNYLKQFQNVIFEGAQGIMLDMDHGVFPNVTYGHTTSRNAIEVLEKAKIVPAEIHTYYVTRCYQTRHGAGWMAPTEPVSLVNNEGETNVFNEWQREFRTAELDFELLKYAIRADRIYNPESSRRGVITCLDQRPTYDPTPLMEEMARAGVHKKRFFGSYGPEAKDITPL